MSKIQHNRPKYVQQFHVMGMLIAFLFLGGSRILSAQSLKGKVYTLGENRDTSVVYMARLQWKNTTVGTYSEADGSYVLPRTNTDTLIVSYSFYKPDTLIIPRSKRQYNIFVTTSQSLKEVVISRRHKEKYVRKGNPAVELAHKVIEHKNDNRIESAAAYKSKSYNKILMTFGRFSMDFQKNRFNRQFSFLEKYIDTIPIDTVPVLTFSLRETLADHYYQKTPHRDVTYITAKRMQGADESLDQEGVGTNIDAMFTQINIFDNDIELMLNRFVSPLSSTLATTYYRFFITDTLEIDSVSCIELSFAPVNNRSFGFVGRLYIVNDSTYALKRYAINVPVNINLNYVQHLSIEQEFEQTESGWWAPKTSQTFAAFSLAKRMRRIYVQQTTQWYDYELGTTLPDSVDALLNGTNEATATVWKYKSWQWKKMRPTPLTAKEAFLDSLAAELRRLPVFKAVEKTGEILATGYIATNKDRKQSRFDIGPIYDLVSFNETEGVRVRLGGMTTAKLHDQWFMNGYMAYGFKDQRIKYNVTMTHSFVKKMRHVNESPRHALQFSYSYDIEMPGQSYALMDRDNLLMSYTMGEPVRAAQYVRRAKLRYEHEWPFRLRLDTWLQYDNNEATGSLAYWRIQRDGSIAPVTAFNNLEWCVQLRWAPGERIYNNQSGKDNLLKLSKDAPVIRLTHTAGILDHQCRYHRTDLSMEKRIWLSSFGHIDAVLQGGIVWSQVPYPKLYVPQSNTSLFLSPNTFCLLRPMEFFMDKYVALYATYYLKGWIFNRIPLWNRLRLR